MSGASLGWRLRLPGDHRAALGDRELVHILAEMPVRFTVPATPRHCRQVFMWGERILPIFDLAGWLSYELAGAYRLLVIVAFRAGPGAVGYGALGLDSIPSRVTVSDDDALPPEELDARWCRIAHGAFRDEERAVPILDLSRIFSDAPGGG